MQRTEIVTFLAEHAQSSAEAGELEDNVRAELLGYAQALGAADPRVIADAASAVSGLPQPANFPPETAQRMRELAELTGLLSAEDRLLASLRAREWLQRLAVDVAASARPVPPARFRSARGPGNTFEPPW